MAAAARVIVAQGLSAPTAVIAQEAGVSNGSLFTYFETKADLFNQLYLELKGGMASAAMNGFKQKAPIREQFFHIWTNWMRWALNNPEKRRALAQLGVSDEITPETRAKGHQLMSGIADVIKHTRADGPMRDAPLPFVSAMLNALAEATMDFMISDPTNADEHCRVGIEAAWRLLA